MDLEPQLKFNTTIKPKVTTTKISRSLFSANMFVCVSNERLFIATIFRRPFTMHGNTTQNGFIPFLCLYKFSYGLGAGRVRTVYVLDRYRSVPIKTARTFENPCKKKTVKFNSFSINWFNCRTARIELYAKVLIDRIFLWFFMRFCEILMLQCNCF